MKHALAILFAIIFSGLTGFAKDTAEGKSGTSVGVIVQIEGAKYFIESEDGRHEYMAYWREGGLDEKMVKRLKKFKVGDKVKVQWTMQERRRFDKIQKVKAK
jgi:hypothetical protein